MEKGELITYTITLFSLVAFIYFISGAKLEVPKVVDTNFAGLTGNVVLNPKENLVVGDKLSGEIILKEIESDVYGVLLLSKDGNPIVTKTFNLKEIQKSKTNSGYSIKIEDLVDYSFDKKGNYELFLSVLDLDIRLKEEFVVN